jgi:hypothetical protein
MILQLSYRKMEENSLYALNFPRLEKPVCTIRMDFLKVLLRESLTGLILEQDDCFSKVSSGQPPSLPPAICDPLISTGNERESYVTDAARDLD